MVGKPSAPLGGKGSHRHHKPRRRRSLPGEEGRIAHSSACTGAEEARQLHAGVERDKALPTPAPMWVSTLHLVHWPFTLQRHFPVSKRAHQFSGVSPLHPPKVRPVGNRAHSAAGEACLLPQSSMVFVHKCDMITRQLRKTNSMKEKMGKEKIQLRRYRSFNRKNLDKNFVINTNGEMRNI